MLFRSQAGKGMRSCVRYACLLARQGAYEKAIFALNRGLDSLDGKQGFVMGDVRIIARLNRAIITAIPGRAETGISEIRSISKLLGASIRSLELRSVINKLAQGTTD